MKLRGKVAIVTGAGQGIGRVIALTLAMEGAALAVADLDPKSAARTAKEINNLDQRAISLKTDVTNSQNVQNMVQETISEFGKIDILVNNAGIYPSAPIIEIDEEMWDMVLSVNLKGCFLCSQAAIRTMMIQKTGVIINIASVDAKMRTTGNAHYAAAKAGVISFTRTLACEMAPYGIRVNAVSPGWIETDVLMDNPTRYRQALKEIPVGRLGKPEDVAFAVLYLVSDVASYVNGEILDVNGGMFMD